MGHIKIDEKDQKLMEEKFKCYVKVAFPKDTELKTKQILDFYYKHQTEILKKAKELSKSCCSTKNIGGYKTRSKSKSKSKKGGDILEMFWSVALITIGMMTAGLFGAMWSLPNPSDDDLEVETEQQHPHDQIHHSRPRNNRSFLYRQPF